MAQTRSSFAIDALLRSFAGTQLGLVTTAEATAAGIARSVLTHRCRAGALVPVFPCVYRLAAVATSPVQHILAGALAVPGSLITGPSAAVIHEMPIPRVLRAHTAEVILAVGPTRTIRLAGIRAHRLHSHGRSRPWMTTRLSTPSVTLVVLVGYLDEAALERCLDHGLAARTLSVVSVLQALATVPVRAIGSAKTLRKLLADRSERGLGHRSRIEQHIRRWLDNAGLGGWRRNHLVAVGHGDEVEVDFAWVAARVALEVSPFYTHGSRAQQERDAERRRLLVLAGWTVVEALDADLVNEAAFAPIAATLRTLIAAAA